VPASNAPQFSSALEGSGRHTPRRPLHCPCSRN
jgi:hypothetical protein